MSMASLGQAGKRKFPDEVVDDDDDDDIDYVKFSIRGQDGRQLYFKVNQDALLIKVFKKYCERVNLEFETMRFLYYDSYVRGERQTPKMLNMENGAEIFAATQQSGGGGAALNF